MKRILKLILSLVLMLGLASPALAATAKAVTMRVQLAEGSVTIKDASGVTLAYSEDMQLYSGYSVTTGDNSCAYISLDDSKAIKLDMNTSVTIKKSGRKLQVKLLAGQIVFNVTAPLEGNEDFEIRTSSMVTGIRGSSGVVSLRKVIYGTGHGTVHRVGEQGSTVESYEIYGGQLLELTGDGSEMQAESARIEDFPSIYLNEVAENEDLQKALEDEGNYDVDAMIAQAPEAEMSEQAAHDEAAAAMTALPEDEVIPAFTNKTTVLPTLPDIPVIPVEPEPEPEPEPEAVTYTVTWKNGNETIKEDTVTEGDMPAYEGDEPTKDADAQYTYTFSGWDADFSPVTEDVTYNAVFTSTLNTYTVTWLNDGGQILETDENVPYGTVPSYDGPQPEKEADQQYTYAFSGWDAEIAAVTGDASYTADYRETAREYQLTVIVPTGVTITVGTTTFQADGSLTAKYNDSLDVNYTLSTGYVSGTRTKLMVDGSEFADGSYTVTGDAEITVADVYRLITELKDGDVIDYPAIIRGQVVAEGECSLEEELNIEAGGSLTVAADAIFTITEAGTLNCAANGEIRIGESATLNNYGTINNDGILTNNYGDLNNYSGNTIVNNYRIYNRGTLTNGSAGSNGRIVNGPDAQLINNGTLIIGSSGSSIENEGLLVQEAPNQGGTGFNNDAGGTVSGGTIAVSGGVFGDGGVDDIFWYLMDLGNNQYSLTLCTDTANGSAIPDYDDAAGVPWSRLAQQIVSVELVGKITGIGDYVFSACGFENAVIPDSVTEIGELAFYNCTQLTGVTIGSGVTVISRGAFANCEVLKSIVIPDNVTSIEADAFFGCFALADLTIGSGVKTIGDDAFENCGSLTSVTIPDNVTTLGVAAFYYCDGLETVVIGSGVTEIGSGAFRQCSGLTDLTIGSGVTTIGEGAFEDCDALTNVTIPDNVTAISEGAFSGCDNLASIVIPDSVTTLGPNAFSGCYRLASAVIGKGITVIDEYTFSDCTSLTNLTFPDNVAEIGEGAFAGCEGLTEVTIKNVLIGKKAFIDCSNLRIVYFLDQPQDLDNDQFLNTDGNFHIIYPGSLSNEWQTYHEGNNFNDGGTQNDVTDDTYCGYSALPWFTVSFVTYMDDVTVEPQIVIYGAYATEPEDPVPSIENVDFRYWSSDPDAPTQYYFDTPVTKDTVLYAFWVAVNT